MAPTVNPNGLVPATLLILCELVITTDSKLLLGIAPSSAVFIVLGNFNSLIATFPDPPALNAGRLVILLPNTILSTELKSAASVTQDVLLTNNVVCGE